MDAIQVIEQIKKAVSARQSKGDEAVDLGVLTAFLDQLQHDAGTDAANALQQREHEHQWGVEMVRSGIDAGGQALKTCLLISGGSAAALLAFAGSAWSALTPAGLEMLGTILTRLAIALLLTGCATSLTYLCQYFFAERLSWHKQAGDIAQWFASGLVVAAYGFVGWAFLNAGSVMSMFKLV